MIGKTIKVDEKEYSKLIAIKYDKNLKNMSLVISYLLDSYEKQEKKDK